MKIKFLPILLIAFLAMTACKKSGQNPGATASTGEVDVYVCGTVLVAPSFTQATVWKNGIPTTLSTDHSSVFGITSQGKDVYALGEDRNGSCYWKNNVRVQVENNKTNYSAGKIAVLGNDVYTAGFVDSTAAYCKNGIITKLTSPSGYAIANGLAIKGNDVYVCGDYYYHSPFYNHIPCYWKNGALTILDKDTTKNSTAIAIAVNGNDIHVVINSLINELSVPQYLVFLWKNGTITLIDKDVDSRATGIFINGNDVYISGVEDVPVPISGFTADYRPFQGGYWKNGVLTKLPDIYSSQAIAVQAGNIYVAGDYLSIGGANPQAAYWKNGKMGKLDENQISYVTGIALVPK
ncbi:MAG: hypothetical protein JWR50_4128 [Mucilaginibacter sp.]|nr:hypothetical protein [Mucilaginibacter sp.]